MKVLNSNNLGRTFNIWWVSDIDVVYKKFDDLDLRHKRNINLLRRYDNFKKRFYNIKEKNRRNLKFRTIYKISLFEHLIVFSEADIIKSLLITSPVMEMDDYFEPISDILRTGGDCNDVRNYMKFILEL